MALVGRSRAGVGLVVLAVATTCSSGGGIGRVEVELYDVAVECEPERPCRDPASGDVVTPVALSSWVFTSTSSTQFDGGLFVYFELRREDGTVAHVELDVPPAGTRGAMTTFSYIELDGERRVFESSSARGRIELSADLDGSDCDCTDGRFELVFVNPGPDGLYRTDDDTTRRLSRARFGIEDYFCLPASTLATPEDETVVVTAVERCPPNAPDPSPSEPEPYPDGGSYESSCGSDSSSSESSGCGDDSSSSSDSGGCGDDSSSGSDSGGCEGDSGGGGCEGDSSGGGCEGDSGGSGCGGDAGGCDTPKAHTGSGHVAARLRRAPRDQPWWTQLGRMQLGLLVGVALLFVRRSR